MFKLVVLSSVLALAASSAIAPLGLGVHGLGWGGLAGPWGAGHLAGAWGAGHLAAPLAAPWGGAHLAVAHGPAVAAAPALHAYNYRGPLSLGPHQPANIVAADGRPLDTISVNLDRAAHYTAKAVDGHAAHGAHWLKKRSAPVWAPAAAWSHSARIDIPAAHWGAPALGWGHAGVAPLAAPLAGPLGWGHAGAWGHGAALGHLW
ncbi:hypothetical protein NE865_02527 [Phthorimaea operculella]|nr:hypothetical protein NE865_02527 [Phthorimaea operculella]